MRYTMWDVFVNRKNQVTYEDDETGTAESSAIATCVLDLREIMPKPGCRIIITDKGHGMLFTLIDPDGDVLATAEARPKVVRPRPGRKAAVPRRIPKR